MVFAIDLVLVVTSVPGKMSSAASDVPLLMQVMSASHAIASQAGKIIREIMKAGDLGVVLKNQVRFCYQSIAQAKGAVLLSLLP